MPLDFSGSFFKKNEKPSANSMSEEKNDSQKKAISTSWETVKPKYQLDDLILDKYIKETLLDIISFYKYQNKLMNAWGLSERFSNRINLTVNLYGESGTGKTMAAHAIANALGKEILFVDYAEIESKYVGETAKNIKQLFETASQLDAVIIFDEADALLSKRVTDMRSSADVSVNQTRSVLLNILNEYTGVVLFTTNFIQNFDPAFIRRIRYQVKFELPNEELREKLWKMYIPMQMPTDVDIDKLAKTYDAVSGSDIANAVFVAAIKAARREDEMVLHSDFEMALNSIVQVKKDHKGDSPMIIKKNIVSEEYVKEKLGKNFPKEKE